MKVHLSQAKTTATRCPCDYKGLARCRNTVGDALRLKIRGSKLFLSGRIPLSLSVRVCQKTATGA